VRAGIVVIALGLLVATLSGTLMAAAPAAKATSLEVQLASSSSAPPYRALLTLPGPAHLVCPFDYRKETRVRAFVPASRALVPGSRIADMTVLAAEPVDDPRRRYSECSDLLSGFDQRSHDRGVDSYVWAPRKPAHQLSAEQMMVQVRAHNDIAFSGLPIVSDLGSNVGFCFEMVSNADRPPSYWLAMVGVAIPPWAVERKVSGVSCEEAIRTLN